MIAKPISIKDAKRKFGGCAWKASELISGELLHVSDFVTEGGVIHPDPAAAVSSGRTTHASEEGPNSERE
jgi:hypothetical protein